jgi:hypothetical protein
MKRKVERDGRALCSRRDPVKEARDWVARQRLFPFDRTVVVLGFGAGYHLEELRRSKPELKIFVYELDPDLSSSISEQGFEQLLEISSALESSLQPDVFLSFLPSWVGYEVQYEKAFEQATARAWTPQQEESPEWNILKELVR